MNVFRINDGPPLWFDMFHWLFILILGLFGLEINRNFDQQLQRNKK